MGTQQTNNAKDLAKFLIANGFTQPGLLDPDPSIVGASHGTLPGPYTAFSNEDLVEIFLPAFRKIKEDVPLKNLPDDALGHIRSFLEPNIGSICNLPEKDAQVVVDMIRKRLKDEASSKTQLKS